MVVTVTPRVQAALDMVSMLHDANPTAAEVVYNLIADAVGNKAIGAAILDLMDAVVDPNGEVI